MDDEFDAAREEFIEELWRDSEPSPDARDRFCKDLYEEIFEGLSNEGLRSAFLADAGAAEPALEALWTARRYHARRDSTAALLFSAIATEVALKQVLVGPILRGLMVIDDTKSKLVRLALRVNRHDLFLELVSALENYCGVNPRSHPGTGRHSTLWAEMEHVRKVRHEIAHRARNVHPDDADLSLAVASCFLEQLVPSALRKLGLALNDGRIT